MSNVPHDLPYDNRLARMRKRLQGLQRVAAAINDLYIYGVYPSNYPNLTTVLYVFREFIYLSLLDVSEPVTTISNPSANGSNVPQ